MIDHILDEIKGVPSVTSPPPPSHPAPSIRVCVAEALAELRGALDVRLSGALGLKAGPEELTAMLGLEEPLTAGKICTFYTKVGALLRAIDEPCPPEGHRWASSPCLGAELISGWFLLLLCFSSLDVLKVPLEDMVPLYH